MLDNYTCSLLQHQTGWRDPDSSEQTVFYRTNTLLGEGKVVDLVMLSKKSEKVEVHGILSEESYNNLQQESSIPSILACCDRIWVVVENKRLDLSPLIGQLTVFEGMVDVQVRAQLLAEDFAKQTDLLKQCLFLRSEVNIPSPR